MAASNQEDETRRFKLDDVLKSLRSRVNDDDEEGKEDTKSDNELSMFCKNCLHPYSGQEKSGALVLRCERCGHRDIVPEQEASTLNPDKWKGNLMMNRFLQVLKEQEELCINIVDPDFADDDYKRLSMALDEYCTYMNAIAMKLYDIASAAKEEYQAKKANEGKMSEDSDATGYDTSQEVNVDRGNDSVTISATPDFSQMSEEEIVQHPQYFTFSEAAKQEMKSIGATIIKVMKALVLKHELSPDIWDIVEEKMRTPNSENDLTPDAVAAESQREENVPVKEEVRQDCPVEQQASSAENAGEPDSDDVDTVLEQEVLGALKNKFSVTSDEEPFETTLDLQQTYSDVLRTTENIDFNIEDYKVPKDEATSKPDTESEGETASGVEDQSPSAKPAEKDAEDKSPAIEINFYLASTIFMSELQGRKREALLQRKEKALAIVNEKIVELKDEMERVENEVRDELHSAYETKVKKVENQRKQLSTRHQHLQDIEALLTHYMETGQMDKLAEVMAELDIQYDN